MNSPDTALEPRSSRRATPKLGRLGITFAFVLVLSVGLTGCFRVNSDARALRDSVMKSAAAEWDEKIEIGVGAVTVSLARAGLAFVDLDPEARSALSAVRGADVGVYQLRRQRKPMDRAAVLSAADKAMAARGWDRVVAVVRDREMVAAYVPRGVASTRNAKACLVVLNGAELVVVSARSNLEPLMEIAFRRAEWRQLARPPARL